MYTRAIATPPDEDTLYEEYSAEDSAARLAEENAEAAKPIPVNVGALVDRMKSRLLDLPLSSRVKFASSGTIPNILGVLREGDIEAAVAMIDGIPTIGMTAVELAAYNDIRNYAGLS